ncbi:MAG: D-alanine--D-alanine ligase [Rhodothermales bacterium]|nr:D-alanine--D-alanine ligase [Rhodothermales bacterium]MBO6780879.1 D-alanine--D-alanine ligase [Rhodothermales bacterium]
MTPRKRVGVFFGGVSPEHEVSIISALQAMAALDTTRWVPVPVYVGKDGSWWCGDGLRRTETFKQGVEEASDVTRVRLLPTHGGRLVLEQSHGRWGRRQDPIEIDIALPVMHGGAGENGNLQGLFETAGVAYAGSGPMAAALAMDKAAAKRWAGSFDVPQVPFAVFDEAEWAGSEERMLDALVAEPGLPCIVKPARLGSSIGISKAATREELDAAVEEALRYDGLVVVEKAVQQLRELNCSVLGRRGDARASVLEEPLSGDELLSFKDKYMRGDGGGTGAKGAKTPAAQGMASLDRKIPAPVSESMTTEVRALAVKLFEAFDCQGVVRIDFLLDGSDGSVYFNEINTMPGSLSFYLWEPSGVPFPKLLDRVLELGLERHRQAQGRIRTYDVNLLSERDLGGLKGAKG